jgi:hypothetical protein
MDPFSIAAGAIGISSAAAKLTETIVVFIQTTREARSELLSTKSELSNLCTILDLLRSDTESSGDDDAAGFPETIRNNLSAVLDSCSKDITELTKVLEEHNSHIARVKWAVSGKSRVLQLNRHLESHCRALDLALDFSAL